MKRKWLPLSKNILKLEKKICERIVQEVNVSCRKIICIINLQILFWNRRYRHECHSDTTKCLGMKWRDRQDADQLTTLMSEGIAVSFEEHVANIPVEFLDAAKTLVVLTPAVLTTIRNCCISESMISAS